MKQIASILATNFRRWRVNYVFGIIGKPLVPLFMEMDKHDINVILSKHENGAGYAAER